MLNPQTPGVLDREQAMALLREVQDVQRRLWRLRYELRRVLEDEA